GGGERARRMEPLELGAAMDDRRREARMRPLDLPCSDEVRKRLQLRIEWHQAISRCTTAGTPKATTPAGKLRVTTAPAPATVSSPIVTPGQTMTPPPSQTLSPSVIGRPYSHPSRLGSGSTGCVAASSWTLVAS